MLAPIGEKLTEDVPPGGMGLFAAAFKDVGDGVVGWAVGGAVVPVGEGGNADGTSWLLGTAVTEVVCP